MGMQACPIASLPPRPETGSGVGGKAEREGEHFATAGAWQMLGADASVGYSGFSLPALPPTQALSPYLQFPYCH
jgi:hypothetical protein